MKKFFTLITIYTLCATFAFGQTRIKDLPQNVILGPDGTVLRSNGTSWEWGTPSTSSGSLPTQIKVANDFTGANLGAKINAADAACGLNVGCEIWVFDGGSVAANTITSQITVGSFHTLKFFQGTFYLDYQVVNQTTGYSEGGAAILMKDNSKLTGTGWNSIIVENDYPTLQKLIPETGLTVYSPTASMIVAPWNSQFSCSPESSNRTCRSSDIHVSNLKFQGVRSNQHDGGNGATIDFVHTYRSSIKNCWFDATFGYAVNIGGTQASANETDLPEGTTVVGSTGAAQGLVSADYAKDGWFTDNLMTNLQSQSVGVITAENYRIERNIFREGGKKPYTITSVTNPSGAPIVVTLSEKHHFFDGGEVVLLNVTATGGAPAISNISYRVKMIPGEPFKFSLNQFASNGTYTFPGQSPTPTYTNVVNGSPSGSYTTGATSATDWRTVGTVAIDFEPNGSPWEVLGGHTVINNLFDFRVVHGVILYQAILYQAKNAGQDIHSTTISGNTILGRESGTGQMAEGIGLASADNKDVIVTNNYVKGAYSAGIAAQGKRLFITDNLLVDCGGDPGGGGQGSLALYIVSDSTISGNRAINPTSGLSYIAEGLVNSGNVFQNNVADAHTHLAGSTITNSKYLNNTWAGSIAVRSGFTETTNSNNNLFKGNISHPRLTSSGALGLVLIGTGSKVLTHHYTDGRTFITSINGTLAPFTNPTE